MQKKIVTTTDGLGMVASAAPCKISAETNREGIVILDGGLIPYKKGGLNVAHATKYWSYYAHILPDMNHTSFPMLQRKICMISFKGYAQSAKMWSESGKLHLKQPLSQHSIKVDTLAEVSQ